MILFSFFFLLILISLIGIYKNKKNLLFFVLFMEIILISFTSLFAFYSLLQGSFFGQIYGLYILTIAAIESAIIICLIVHFYRFRGSINVSIINQASKK